MTHQIITDQDGGKLVLTRTQLHELSGGTTEIPFHLQLRNLKVVNGKRPKKVKIVSLMGNHAIVFVGKRADAWYIGCRNLSDANYKLIMKAADAL